MANTNDPWPSEREEQLRGLLEDEGLTPTEAASRMGLSKGAVSGKLSRIRQRRGLGRPTFERRIDQLAEIHASRVPIEIVPWGRCQWPYGDVGRPGFHFCGEPAIPAKPYCNKHTAIAWGQARERQPPS